MDIESEDDKETAKNGTEDADPEEEEENPVVRRAIPPLVKDIEPKSRQKKTSKNCDSDAGSSKT